MDARTAQRLSMVLIVISVLAVACSQEDDVGRAPTLRSLSPAPVSMSQVPNLSLMQGGPADSPSPITFTPVNLDVPYVRVPPARFDRAIEFYEATITDPVVPMDAAIWPADPYGTAGVAIFDADGDRDLDIYVTNAADAPNSLLVNQLTQEGAMRFVDRGQESGAAALGVEGGGVCQGDVNNDRAPDLFVVGNGTPSQLLLGDGAGNFSPAPGLPDTPSLGGSTCTMGDVNADGLLDVVVAHSFDHDTSLALVAEPFAFNLPNELLIQRRDGRFVDEAATRGLHTLAGVPEGTSGISWGVALVDIDADGDLDMIETDDQTTMLPASRGGVDRGLVQVFTNDGTGMFTATDAGTLTAGTWMGTAWVDFDCDQTLDMFAGNFGDYGLSAFGVPFELGEYAARWLLGDGDGGFTDPGVGDVGATHFAWGGVAEDFDNDGDPDLLFQGGLDASLLVDLSNPGTLLTNDGCDADFTQQDEVFAVNHRSRLVTGTAAGDLDGDGFVDVVTASGLVVPEPAPIFPAPTTHGLPTNGTAFFTSPFMPDDDGAFSYLGFPHMPGDLVIEINSGNDNAGVTIAPVGSFGLTPDAITPRSGYGTIVTVTPEGGQPFTKPLQGGTGYLSSDSPVINAGLGQAAMATVDVQWPGRTRNRFYDVPAGTTLVAPEIPCSYDDQDKSVTEYTACVSGALRDLADEGVIDDDLSDALLEDALRAREDG